MNALEIRIATDCDLESLVDAHGPGISAAQIKRRLEESRKGFRTMLVAVKEGRAVGSVSIGGGSFQRKGSLRLFALDVGPEFRRNGIGTALVEAVEAKAAAQNLDEVNLEVEIDNEGAIRLYRRLGYTICGEPVMDRWTRLGDDGSSETIEVPVFVMVKRLVATTDPTTQLRSCPNPDRTK
ncbi:MAG: GNAT family N-acetyltransferase [Chloroflexi bacterium]|nr:GNAT family N-acetyltransferase [Chloroflexota bacterium]